MPNEQREEFERRLLALVRSRLDTMDEDYPHGWEITDFVITARYYYAPEPDTPLDPWDGGPYPGWAMNGWTRGSSGAYWHDAELLQDALYFTRNRPHQQVQEGVDAEPGVGEEEEED
jgi:hypothetical protein